MLKQRLSYGLLLVAACIIYLLADRREALIFLILIAGLPVVSALLCHMAVRSIHMKLLVRQICRVGEQIPVTIQLEKKNSLPMGTVHFILLFETRLYGQKKNVEFTLQPVEKKEMIFEYNWYASDCGAVRIYMKDAQCRDFFGLFSWKIPAKLMEEILVYPADLHIETELQRRPETKNFGDLYAPNRTGQDVSEVAGLRDYVAGDSLKSIHWKLSGKMDRMIVREFGYPSNYNTLILYEIMTNSESGTISNARNNIVLAMISALSYSLLEKNLEHHVGRFLQDGLQSVPVNSLQSHEMMIEEILYSNVDDSAGKGDLAYRFAQSNLSETYTKLIYITPDYVESEVRSIAHEIDLTVIHVTEGGDYAYSSIGGYTVIPVDVDTCLETIHSITI
jgi:uncharacterized protein (DUF58 family)